MKAAIPSLLALLVFAIPSFADDKPRTIVTRDHQVYEKALIVDHTDVSVTISYDAGVVRVPMENLPADIQKQLGYISQVPEPPKEIKSANPAPTPAIATTTPAAAPTPAPVAPSPVPHPVALAPAPIPSSAPARIEQPPIAPERPVPVAASEAMPTAAPAAPASLPTPTPAKPFTQAEANALYGLKQASILKKWGKPVKIEKFTDLSKRQVTVLVYDEDEATGTKFWIYDKDGFVSGGCCKGRPIRSVAQQAKLDKSKAAGN